MSGARNTLQAAGRAARRARDEGDRRVGTRVGADDRSGRGRGDVTGFDPGDGAAEGSDPVADRAMVVRGRRVRPFYLGHRMPGAQLLLAPAQIGVIAKGMARRNQGQAERSDKRRQRDQSDNGRSAEPHGRCLPLYHSGRVCTGVRYPTCA